MRVLYYCALIRHNYSSSEVVNPHTDHFKLHPFLLLLND